MVIRFLLCTIALLIPLNAEELFKSEKNLDKIQATELVLNNGLHVYFRPSENNEEEVMLQLAAAGGYSTLPLQDQPSARLAAEIVWESGFGSLTTDQLSALLYNYSIELEFCIKPFYRTISGECSTESLPMLIKIISDFLVRPQFHQTGLDNIVKSMSEVIDNITPDKSQKFENAYLVLNTKSRPKNNPLTKEDLKTISLKNLPDIFDRLYANPQDFCCVITGDFDVEFIKPYVIKFLGEIPSKKPNLDLSISFTPQFPSQPESQIIPLKNGPDSLTRITFPITHPVDGTNIYKLEMACQTIEAHLRSLMQRRLKSSYGVDVAYEFPFYPSFIFPWIAIQFRSDFDQADDLAKIIVSEIQHLKIKGPSLSDLETAELSQKANEEFCYCDDAYWLSFLTNAYLMRLNPSAIFENLAQDKSTSIEKMKETLATMIEPTRYTQLTTKPE